MLQMKATVVANEPLSAECWRMTLAASPIAAAVSPGQFVHVKIGDGNDPLLRRAFSIFRTIILKTGERAVQVVYQVTGRGTGMMSKLRPGDRLDIIGPLGHGFERFRDRRTHVLLGGGSGAAGLFLLGEEIAGVRQENLNILLGAETKECLVLEEDFRDLGGNLMLSTDDGTYGYRGLATEMLLDAIKDGKIPTDCAIYACGPWPMLKSLAGICREFNIPAQVAMEKHMMCGIGACMVCVCRVNKAGVSRHRDLASSHIELSPDQDWGYALVCADGPVFNIDEVAFDE
ncbi:MAG: dihydroorotate dehydrogenase electron transfer subunit [Chloroflexota bacterium]